MKKLLGVLSLGLAVLFLSWPAVINGQLFLFPDSTNYIRAGGAAVSKVFGTSFGSDWYPEKKATNSAAPLSAPAQAAVALATATPSTAAAVAVTASSAVNDPEHGVVMAGRSPYVGALMFLAGVLGNFWPFALALALLQLGLIHLVCQVLLVPGVRARLIAAAVVGLLTPAAFYNGFLMADAFCAMGLLAFAIWFAFPERLSRYQRLFLFLLMVLATTSHLTHVVVLAGALVTAALMLWLEHRRVAATFSAITLVSGTRVSGLRAVGTKDRKSAPAKERWALVSAVAVLGIGLLSIRVTNAMIERSFGQPPLQVPMLTPRFIEDGPGADFVRDHCDNAAFTLCQLKRAGHVIPTDSQRFLWDQAAGTGLYMLVDADTRRALSAEDSRFALAVLLQYPVAQSLAMLHNAVSQLLDFGLSNFNYGVYVESFAAKVPSSYFSPMQHSLSYRNAWPLTVLDTVNMLTLLAACAGIFVLCRRDTWLQSDVHAFRLVVLICGVGLVCNAFICGAASEPQARYMARVIWIPTLLALVGGLRALSNTKQGFKAAGPNTLPAA